jgi:predicted NAD/FAD-dependent oxidoreductase
MRVVVVGAGLSGLAAARELATEHEVTVLERSPIIGGRLATVDIGGGRADAGAQFFTVRGPELRSQVDDWLERGVAQVWCHGFARREDGYPRYVGTSGMATLAADIASGLDIRTGQMVFTLRRTVTGWSVVIDDSSTFEADAVVMTCPAAQAWALLAQSPVQLPEVRSAGDYHRTIALLLALDRPSVVPPPGAIQFDPADASNPFGFVTDNLAKGISQTPTMTLHATQPWSLDHWDDDTALVEAELLARARPWIGSASVTERVVRRWRFAGPIHPATEPFHLDVEHRLLFTGDRFAGAKFEGAFRSGLSGGRRLLDELG